MRSLNIYRYILTSDNGMAPCVDDKLVSLATCKPTIRRCAREGDWVVGFHSSPAGLVAWAGRVARTITIADYEREFRGRSDAVYQEKPDGSFRRLRKNYHNEPLQIARDLSAPALLFHRESTWYFGDNPQLLPEMLSHLAPRGQGHRVNGVASNDPRPCLPGSTPSPRPEFMGNPKIVTPIQVVRLDPGQLVKPRSLAVDRQRPLRSLRGVDGLSG